MKKVYLVMAALCSSFWALAQPSIPSAAGYSWVKTGTATYTSGPVSTTPDITSGNTNFGRADSDPNNCSTTGFCGGNCDGIGKFGSSIYGAGGAYAAGTQSNCEQRAVTLQQWTNSKPESSAPNPATAGTEVYLPTAASVRIIKAVASFTVGTGAGAADQNFGKLYGGSGASNSITVNYDYDIKWNSARFTTVVGSQNVTRVVGGFVLNSNGGYTPADPGQRWYNGAFGSTIDNDVTYTIPLTNITQDGSLPIDVNFASTHSIGLVRNYGDADAFAEAQPGMEGRASFTVEYDIWAVQAPQPLRLIDFYATKGASGVLVQWQAAGEQGNSHYVLQRSYDGRSFADIATVQVRDNLVNPSYQYEDKLSNQKVYYRLKLVEKTGAIILSKVIVLDASRSTQAEIQRLGASSFVLKAGTTAGVIDVMDSRGALLQRINTSGFSTPIELARYGSGVYIITYSVVGEKTQSFKVNVL